MLCGSDWGWGERLVKKIEKTAKTHLRALHLKEQEVKIRKARGGREKSQSAGNWGQIEVLKMRSGNFSSLPSVMYEIGQKGCEREIEGSILCTRDTLPLWCIFMRFQ